LTDTVSTRRKKKINEQVLDDHSILVEIPQTTASHMYCFVCSRDNSYQKLRSISQEAIIDVYVERNVFIPKGSRCCPEHLNSQYLLKTGS